MAPALPPRALRAWLAAAARTSDRVAAAQSCAVAVADEPWSVVVHAGFLARCAMAPAPTDLGLTRTLRRVKPDSKAAIAVVPQGAPIPTADRGGQQRRGAFDTPPAMARAVVGHGVRAADAAPKSGLDPACGPGAFLLAMHDAGITELYGTELDPAAAAVARVAVPSARVDIADGMRPGAEVDLVAGNPPFVSPERQSPALRAALQSRFPWLNHRFDLAVPFAEACVERCRSGGAVALVLPSSLCWEPYGLVWRQRWLAAHRFTHLAAPLAFPGAAVRVATLAIRVDGPPGPLPDHGLSPAVLLALASSPLDPAARPGDGEIISTAHAHSTPLGALAKIDTGVVSHGPKGGKERLLSDSPGPGRVPYADARDLTVGRVRYLQYSPAEMHRPKHPALFVSPKLLVQRLRGANAVRSWVDRSGLFAGHTLTVVRPDDPRVTPEALQQLLTSPLVAGILRIERGPRLDLYPRDLQELPIPNAWIDAPETPLAQAWGLSAAQAERLATRAPPPDHRIR